MAGGAAGREEGASRLGGCEECGKVQAGWEGVRNVGGCEQAGRV